MLSRVLVPLTSNPKSRDAGLATHASYIKGSNPDSSALPCERCAMATTWLRKQGLLTISKRGVSAPKNKTKPIIEPLCKLSIFAFIESLLGTVIEEIDIVRIVPPFCGCVIYRGVVCQ